MPDSPDHNQRLINIVFDEDEPVRRRPEVEHERAVAIEDILDGNRFAPAGELRGPYVLHIVVEGQRLLLRVHDESDRRLGGFVLNLAPLRQVIRDYFVVCDSYYEAIRNAPPHKIEALDMGRRGLHDEGSQMLRERLADQIEIDQPTARRLFTLICVLHARG